MFETEPLPQDSPLWRRSDVFVTPHNAAISHPDAVARAIAEQILAHERGEPLRNVVDRGQGVLVGNRQVEYPSSRAKRSDPD